MLDSMNFTTLLLGELALIMLMLSMLVLIYALKQRKLYRRLLGEYRKLRTGEGQQLSAEPKDTLVSGSSAKATADLVAHYLDDANQEALERFKKITHATVPRLGPDLSFSAKVAALRFLYTEAEAEVHRQPAGLHGRWMTFERKFADIVRRIGQETKSQKPQRNHRLRLLQERIDALKPFEVENARLLKQLNSAKNRQAKLEQYQADSRKTITNLQKMIRTLQRSSSSEQTHPEQTREDFQHYSAQDHVDDALIAHEQSLGQINSISDLSSEKNSLLKKIADELHISYANLPPQQRKKLDDVIKSLEIDLMKSDQHIANLRKELKTTRDNINQQPLVIHNKAIPMTQEDVALHIESASPTEKAERIEDVLKVIHTNLAENEKQLNQRLDANGSEGHQRTLAEIQQLRLNNQNQRNIIIDLEKELRILRREVMGSDDETANTEKNQDITRLERLVKECEHCIETLESEVDLLHMQLKEGHIKETSPAPVELEPDIIKLNRELETITNKLQETIKQYQNASIVNRFALDIIACDSVETVARRLIQSIKDLHIIAGFTLHSALGKAEYYAGDHFNPQEKSLIKKAPRVANVGYLNEGILFTNSYLGLMLKNPPNADEAQSILEITLTSLINLTAERIGFLEAASSLAHQGNNLGDWIENTRSHLTELDIQYAFQSEESRRVIDNLVKELKHAMGMIDMSDSARMVFDNAISECQNRIGMLLEGGKVMDQDFARLFEDLDKMNENHKTQTTH